MPEPLRLAYLTSAYGRPSDTFIRNEVDHLRRLGAEVSTFSIRRPPEPPFSDESVQRHRADTVYLFEQGPVRLARAALRLMWSRPVTSWRSWRLAMRTRAPGLSGLLRTPVYYAEAALLAEQLEDRRVEQLHNHIAENSANVAMLAAELAGIPFSHTVHGPGIFYAPEKWRLGDKIAASAFTIAITDFCKSQCMVFTSPEAWGKLRVVRCSVQDAFVEEIGDRPSPKQPAELVAVGRFCAEKGQALLVDAVRELVEEGRPVRLRLIGDGPMRPQIEQRVHELRLTQHVSIEGWRSSSDVRDAMLSATALVMPSFAEGLPIVLMEALAVGCPVVTTSIAGVPELIEHGVSGWLAPAGSAPAFADALRSMLGSSPDQLEAVRDEGRRRVLSRHHPATQGDRLLTLFESSARPDAQTSCGEEQQTEEPCSSLQA